MRASECHEIATRSTELEQLGETIALTCAQLDVLTHRLLSQLREFDARGGWGLQGAQSCAHWLSWRTGFAPGGIL